MKSIINPIVYRLSCICINSKTNNHNYYTNKKDKIPVSKHYVHAKPYADIEEKRGTKHTHLNNNSADNEIHAFSKKEKIQYLQAQNNLFAAASMFLEQSQIVEIIEDIPIDKDKMEVRVYEDEAK